MRILKAFGRGLLIGMAEGAFWGVGFGLAFVAVTWALK